MKKRLWVLFVAVQCSLISVTQGQNKDSIVKNNPSTPQVFKAFIDSSTTMTKGLLNVYFKSNRYYFEIPDSILGRDLLLVNRISKGSSDLRKGIFGYAGDEINNSVVRFIKGPKNKIFINRISFTERSKDSTKDLYSALVNSSVQPIVAAFDIKAYPQNNDGSIIDVTDLLNSDNEIFFFRPEIKRLLALTGIQADKSFISSVHAYPRNVEIVTLKTYTKTQEEGIPGLSLGIPGSPFATVELNTSVVLLPKVPMQSRLSDDRVGYFSISYTDFDDNPQGIKRVGYVKRWRLEPKDKQAYLRGELTEPINPIVFYIDPATPKKWRSYLIQGVMDWNAAFEKAGFKNAIFAKEPPLGDSTWSLDDATHSAIVYKPSSIANASGPSICDPRSGEILESHINWYHNVMELVHDWYMIQAGPIDARARKMVFDDELMGQLIRFVSSHEVGHTLGLLHNYGSSSTVPTDSLRNKAWVEKNGHTPSIMDYARFNYVAQPEDSISEKGIFPRIGDYDKWAIEWGYKWYNTFANPYDEKLFLNDLVIEKLKNKRLYFGSEGNLNDPRCQSEDIGDDAVKSGEYGIKNLKYVLKHIRQWSAVPGEGFANLSRIYRVLVNQFNLYIGHVGRSIAGQYYTPKTVEQQGDVFAIVPKNVQKRAVEFFNTQVLRPPLWLIDNDILSKIGSQPVDMMASLQNRYLDQLLARTTFLKLLNDEATDPINAYTANMLLTSISNEVWAEVKEKKDVSIYKRNLQKQYIADIIKLIQPNDGPDFEDGQIGPPSNLVNNDISSIAKAHLRELRMIILAAQPQLKDPVTRYHLQDCAGRIAKALEKAGIN